nr:Chromate resistance protein ChrB [Rhizobium laguerreae]
MLGRCDDFEAEIAKETTSNHFSYAEIEENDEDLKKLRSWYEKIRRLDFYGATLAAEAEARLAKCEVLLDAYANQVFALQEENRGSSREE